MFRILINRFKKFDHMVTLTPDIASVLLMATIALHNLLSLKSRNNYTLKNPADPVGYMVNDAKILRQTT